MLFEKDYTRTINYLNKIEKDFNKIKNALLNIQNLSIEEKENKKLRSFLIKYKELSYDATNKIYHLKKHKFLKEINRCKIKLANMERFNKLVPEINKITKPYVREFEKIGFKVFTINSGSNNGDYGENLKCFQVSEKKLYPYFCSIEAKIKISSNYKIEYNLYYITSILENDDEDFKKITEITKNTKIKTSTKIREILDSYLLIIKQKWLIK